MSIRSLTFAALMLACAAPLQAADSDGPLAKERGQFRPLVVIAPSSVDPTLVELQKALAEPANRKSFDERKLVLFTVVNTIGKRDGKDLDPQSTMALIRELKLGATGLTKVILVGKDGEKRFEHSGPIEAKDIFAAIDQFPPAENQAAPAAPATPAPAEPAAKPGKAAGNSKAPKALDD